MKLTCIPTLGLALTISLCLLTAEAHEPTADHEWEAGVARSKITPENPIVMAGYSSRQEPFTDVLSDLYAEALFIRHRSGESALLVTCDFIGMRARTANPLLDRIMETTGLSREQIILNHSHCHTGPSQAATPNEPSFLSPEDVRKQYEYTIWMHEQIIDAVNRATQSPVPVRLSHAIGVAPFVMNRREPTADGIRLGHNPRGPADQSVPVLKVTRLDDSPLAVVFGVACHLTTIPPNDNRICGDFAGYAKSWIESEHNGLHALFMQGCGGDAGPYPTGSVGLAQQHGATLGKELSRVLESGDFQKVRGPLKSVGRMEALPLAPEMSVETLKAYQQSRAGWKRWVGSSLLKRKEAGEPYPREYHAPFVLWQFGTGLTLVALPGEVVVDYVYAIERELGALGLWIAAYCNDVFGYLPSRRILEEGGYETRGLYSGEPFSPEVEDVVLETVRDLAITAGRFSE